MPIIQHFSIPAGDDAVINFDVSPDEGATLAGAMVYWEAHKLMVGSLLNPIENPGPLIAKNSNSGHGIEITNEAQLKFAVTINRADTLELLGNYYHEAKVVNADGETITVTQGYMTVTESRIVPS